MSVNRVEYSFPATVTSFIGNPNYLTGIEFDKDADPIYISLSNWYELHIGDVGMLHYLNGKWDFRKDKIRG